jgi:hypothetical protein
LSRGKISKPTLDVADAQKQARGLRGARAGPSLAALSYNFKRAMNMKGAAWMRQTLAG